VEVMSCVNNTMGGFLSCTSYVIRLSLVSEDRYGQAFRGLMACTESVLLHNSQ
jgi:hypothetical protein